MKNEKAKEIKIHGRSIRRKVRIHREYTRTREYLGLDFSTMFIAIDSSVQR